MKLKNSLLALTAILMLSGCKQEEDPGHKPLVEWPTNQISEYTKAVTGYDVEIPAYDKAYKIEVDTTEMVLEGYFGIYCYTDCDSNPEETYSTILRNKGWEVESEKIENFFNAYDPDYKVWLNFAYDSEIGDFEIYVTKCEKTKWPAKDIADAVQLIAPGTQTVIPEFKAYTTVATYYSLYGVLAINGYGFADTIISDYKQILQNLSWEVSFNNNSNEWEGVSPDKNIELHFYIDESRAEINVDVMKHAIIVTGWPEEQIASAIEEMEAIGTVPKYIGGNQKSFAYSSDMFGYIVVVHLKDNIDETKEAENYINYLITLGYNDVGTDGVDRYYALPGTTVGITAYYGSAGTFTIAFLHTDELIK